MKGVDVVLDAARAPAGCRPAGDSRATASSDDASCAGGLQSMFAVPVRARLLPPRDVCREPTCWSSRRSPGRASRSPPARRSLAGAAVITSDCLGPEEVVAPRPRTVSSFPPAMPTALAGAMRRLVDDPVLLRVVANRGGGQRTAHAIAVRPCPSGPRPVLRHAIDSTPSPATDRAHRRQHDVGTARNASADALRRRGVSRRRSSTIATLSRVDGDAAPAGHGGRRCGVGPRMRQRSGAACAAFTRPNAAVDGRCAAPVIVAAVAGTATGWQGIESIRERGVGRQTEDSVGGRDAPPTSTRCVARRS